MTPQDTYFLDSADRKIVKGTGPPNADVLILGEAPDAQEEQQGVPFVGRSGQRLTRLLDSIGLPRSTVRIDNVIQIRPPDNELKRLKEYGLEPAMFFEGARQRARDVNPKVIVGFGNLNLHCFLGIDSDNKNEKKHGITKRRGGIYMWEGVPFIPAIHPAATLRTHEWIFLIEHDLRKAKRILREGFAPPKEDFIIAPNYGRVMEELDRLMDAQFLGIDIETRSYQTIDCLGLSSDENRVLCIPFYTLKGPYWSTLEEERAIWTRVHTVLRNASLKIIQNAMYELAFFNLYGIPLHNLWMDTMLAFHTLYPELPKGLWSIQSLLTDRTYHKDEGRESDKDEDRWIYNCKDVASMFECSMRLLNLLVREGMDHFFFNHYMRTLPAYREMSIRGAKVDLARRNEIVKRNAAEKDGYQERLNQITGKDFNVKSPKDMSEYFLGVRKLKPILTKLGTVTFAEAALWQLKARYPDEAALGLVLKIRNRRTFEENYIQSPIRKTRQPRLSDDGYVRCAYNPAGTVTGRSSSSFNAFGRGHSFHTIPRPSTPMTAMKEYGSCMVATPGRIFVSADLSQAEARVVCYLCDDKEEKKLYAAGESVHKRNAAICMQLPIVLCAKGTTAYDMGKRSKHAYNYGIGPIQLYREIIKEYGRAEMELPAGFSSTMCKKILARFDEHTPLVRQMQAEVKAIVSRNRVLYSPFGRRRIFMEQYGDELFRSANSTIPQATVVDIVHRAMYLLQLPEDVYLVAQKHDSLTVNCKETDTSIEATKAALKKAMEVSIIINGDTMVIPVEFKVGKNFMELG